MVILVLCILGAASAVYAVEQGSNVTGNPQISSRVFVDYLRKTPKYNVTELIIPNGQFATIQCPRSIDTMVQTDVSVFSAAYGINFDDELPAKTGACENTKVSDKLREFCFTTSTCRAMAADPSEVEGCQSRPLRVWFICFDPDRRSVMLSKLID